MSKTKKRPLPTKQQVLDFIRESPDHIGKREIARAFHLTGEDRVWLKGLLKELESEGAIQRGRARRFARPGALPEVAVLEISGTDPDGELLARPLVWGEEGHPPKIYMAPERRGTSALGIGDRVLARLRALGPDTYEGRVIRPISAAPGRVLGVFELIGEAGRIIPTNRKDKAEYIVHRGDEGGAKAGDLVVAELLPGRRLGLRPAKVVERLGHMGNPRAISLVAIHTHGIPHIFRAEASTQAEAAGPAPLDGRVDLRDVPLVTIDGEDARDFDDAVWAEADPDPKNPGGWHILVAIADVAWYVQPDDALDREARERGNSVYFPDRVVPMLPEALSNGWCSLRPNEDRPCMAVHMWLDSEGNKLRHRFVRGMMRSAARLTYTQVQAARDGSPDETTAELVETVIAPLYGAFQALDAARSRRGVLELDLPERKVVLDETGRVARVEPRPRYDSHRLIEEYMIAANVAAAEELERHGYPVMYRVHDEPSRERVEGLCEFLKTLDISFSRGQVVMAKHFNQVLRKAEGQPYYDLVNQVVLRSQAQAVYSPENIGHFGLALRRYAHFTSPIRRYADLLVHRALIGALKLGPGALMKEAGEEFENIAQHISSTERRAATAERDAVDRFTASFLSDRVGKTFSGRITGVTRFGLFVTLNENGADGLVPVATLVEDYYVHDEVRHSLIGRRFGRAYRLGDPVEVRLAEANPVTGGMVFLLVEEGSPAGDRGGARNGRAKVARDRRRGAPKREKRRSNGRARAG